MKFGMYPGREKSVAPGRSGNRAARREEAGEIPKCRPSARVHQNDPAGAVMPAIQARFGFARPHRIPRAVPP